MSAHIVEVVYSGGRVRRVHSSDEARAKARAARFHAKADRFGIVSVRALPASEVAS